MFDIVVSGWAAVNKPYTNTVSIVNVMVMAKSPLSQVTDVS